MFPSFCDQACDPANNMADSCKDHCEGYVFITTSPPSTSGTGASSQQDLSTFTKIIIACCTLGACAILVAVACFYRKKISAICHQIQLRFVKFPQEETGNGNESLSTITVVPGGRSIAPLFTSTEEHTCNLITEHHPCESDALLRNGPTAAPEDSEERQVLIDPDQPGSDQGIASPNPSGFSIERERSSGYMSNDRINHVEQSLLKDDHITSENTIRKTPA